MKIGPKLILAFVAVALLIGVAAFFGIRVTHKIGGEFEKVSEETMPVIEVLDDLKFAGVRIVSSTSEFVLLREERKAAGEQIVEEEEEEEEELIGSGRKLLIGSLEKYEGLVNRYFPNEKEFLEGINERGKKLLESSAAIIALKKEGVSGERVLEAKENFEKDEVAFLEVVNRAIADEESEFAERRAGVESSITNSVRIMLIVGLVTFLVAILFGWFISRSIAHPIVALASVTTRLKEGDLSQRAVVSSKDEIGELASSFNAMAQSIQDKNEELQTFNEELQTTNEELKSTTEELEATNEELKSSNEEMEAANEELRETQEKLVQQEKLAAVGQLASGVGHELRNPLGVMKNAVYYIKTKVPQDDEKLAKHLRIMEKEIDNSTRIISDLLGFSRTRKPAIAPNDINRVVEDALSSVECPSNVRISKELNARLPQAMVDPDQMRQVFLNLALNAVQAMNEGGMLTIATRTSNSSIEIQFRDTGSGIPQENIKKLFDPFFTTKSRGIGLGLAVSHGIVERHNGKIEVQSTIGKGTTFTVSLPAVG